MAYIAFISDQFLKDNTWINSSVDPSLIRPTIRLAQEMYIKPLLGSALYNKVISLISGTPSVAISGDYATLLHDYIQPCLLWYVVAESTVPISLRIANKGIQRRNSENSSPADLNEILTIKDEAKNKAQWYGQRLVSFCGAYPLLYPEYNSPGSTCDTIFPTHRPFDSVLSLTNYRTKSSMRSSGSIPIDYGVNKDCCHE